MTIQTVIKGDAYFDSVTLMTISIRANELAGARAVMIGAGTDMNLEVIRDVGLYTPALDHVTTGDLSIVLDLDDQTNSEEILQQVNRLFTKGKKTASFEVTYKTLDSALHEGPNADLVIISVSGKFTAREARKALDQQKHVMLFSDNMTVDEELALKQKAREKELFVMGPDCGTVVINGVELCFANGICSGDIRAVGTSDVGSQEVNVQIHRHNYRTLQLVGASGHDLPVKVGGLVVLDGLDTSMVDEQAKAILLISKPPAPEITEETLKKLVVSAKPTIIYFIDNGRTGRKVDDVTSATSSLDAVQKVVQFSQTQETGTSLYRDPTGTTLTAIQQQRALSRKFARELFCGDTLCDKLLYALTKVSGDICSSVRKVSERQLTDPGHSQTCTLTNFSNNCFTESYPHPMVDLTSRITCILQETENPETMVLALGFELSYDSHENPVSMLAETLREAKAIAKAGGRELAITDYALGVEENPQNIREQRKILGDLEVLVVDSSHQLCEATKASVEGANEREQR